MATPAGDFAAGHQSIDFGPSDEAALIRRARRDPGAFAELYQRYYPRIARYLMRRTGDAHATEDLVADVFATALRRIGSFRWRGIPARFWLYRIATNAANRWARHRLRAFQPVDEATVVHAPGDCEARSSDDLAQMRAALRSLSPSHQAVIGLHYLEGLSIDETAAVIGTRPGTVKSRLSRSRSAAHGTFAKELDHDVAKRSR